MQNVKLCKRDPLVYDNEVISPEMRVLTIVDWLVGRQGVALERLKKYGLPSVALYDWIMECTKVAHEYLSNPANRDCNKPCEDWNIIAVIPTRGGSKGLPRKSLQTLEEKTLLHRAIKACKGIEHVKRIIVNTDCPEISKNALACGAEVPFLRPKELAGDHSSLDEAMMFFRYWLNLVEGQCYDFLATVSAVTPLLDPQELNIAMQRLSRKNTNSLQATVALPSCSLDYLHMDADGLLEPFCDMQQTEFASYGKQFGAFSLQCFRPYYQIQPWFRPHVFEVTPLPSRPLAHVLPAHQGIEIDYIWDLEACRSFLHKKRSVRFCRKEDLQMEPIDFVFDPVQHFPLCLVFLPHRDQCLEMDGTPVFSRVVAAARNAGIGSVALWGDAKEWGYEGKFGGCPHYGVDMESFPEDVRHAGGIASPEVAVALREQLSLRFEVPLLMLDGRAGMLQEASIRVAMAKAEACPGETVVSVSPPLVHPFYLKHILEDGTIDPVFDGDASRRQNLPLTYSRDGVLCFSPSETACGLRGVSIPQAEGWVLRDIFDGVRALVLAQHTDKQDSLQ